MYVEKTRLYLGTHILLSHDSHISHKNKTYLIISELQKFTFIFLVGKSNFCGKNVGK